MSPLFQIIISLITLLLMGYFAYNIYVIELEKMLKSTPGTKKEVVVFNGILDFKNGEYTYDTYDKSVDNYLPIEASINQRGGAEYSYNFWVYTNKDSGFSSGGKDIPLFLKGEKKLYYSKQNYNCANKYADTNAGKHYNVMIKNPLVKMSSDGSAIVIEYNNINNVESYQQRVGYNNCETKTSTNFREKNSNLIGVYNLDFDKKWYMVSIIMKEVADSGNILMSNKASCKMYINGINVMDKKVETRYMDNIYAATFRNNKSPLYINPDFTNNTKNVFGRVANADNLKLADLKYYNYAIGEKEISQLYSSGFTKSIAVQPTSAEIKYNTVTVPEMELKEIREI